MTTRANSIPHNNQRKLDDVHIHKRTDGLGLFGSDRLVRLERVMHQSYCPNRRQC